ncbi:MAG: DMT family transporter [Prevotella sp.]|jgi:quaternary ammonium compound-resistance protein SugE
MNWIILIVAGLCECSFTFCLGKAKMATGNAHWLWLAGFVFFTVASMYLLMRASRTLPLSIAYPVWTGIGAVGTVLLGAFALREHVSTAQLFFTAMIIVSVIGLKMASSGTNS